MRTRIECVWREKSVQKNLMLSSHPGMGVTTSAGEYRSETGKILVPFDAERREGDKRSTPLPLLVVHSGNTTMTRRGFAATSSAKVIVFSGSAGGKAKHDARARSKESTWTFLELGKLCVKIGSKMAARYSTSKGDV